MYTRYRGTFNVHVCVLYNTIEVNSKINPQYIYKQWIYTCIEVNFVFTSEHKFHLIFFALHFFIFQVQFKTIQEIDFTSASTKKKKLDQAIVTCGTTPETDRRKLPIINQPTIEELATLYADLELAGIKPILLSLVSGYAKAYRPKSLDKKYPKILSELYDHKYYLYLRKG